MIRVLLIGAGGVFGSRLAHGLVRDGFCVICAGRDLGRAERLAQALRVVRSDAVVEAVALDRGAVGPETLRATGAQIVIDAAGPFQDSDFSLVHSALAAGLHYIDLADARGFVRRFGELDAAARARGVVALTGASSTPALTNAVVAELTRGWREITDLEAAISPGARAPRGLSVVQAILSWVGRPLEVFEEGRQRQREGWSGLVFRRFGQAGGRWLSLCDTPDLDLLADRFRPSRSALFLAGLEPAPLHLGMWGLAKLAGLGGLDLTPFAKPLNRLSQLFAPFGSDRGAMRVWALGVNAQGQAAQAVWLLVAEPGAGPVTPGLAALAAVKAIAAKTLAPGARPFGPDDLDLASI